jgi:hemerythrin-like domain-containing protein
LVDALAFLRDDHVEVLAMLDELERGPANGRVAVTPVDLDQHKQLVMKLVMAESAHEAVEEQYFWPSVRHWLEPGKDLAAPALEQEQAAKRLLQRLDKLEPSDPNYADLLRQVIADGREHIAYEEEQVWPVVRERMASSELEELGEKMAKAKKTAPTRPHPNTPPKPGVLKTAGMAAAATDKLRDTATGRGKNTD